ncbi:MAG: hypothetical protein YFSK_6110 [Candidatus Yanofskyibacterium parasiticum]|jgi:hypothetical protein|nr:MAG: hypothetical protein YFSK_6110 [Candidatus Yanofskybacteria bacterium]
MNYDFLKSSDGDSFVLEFIKKQSRGDGILKKFEYFSKYNIYDLLRVGDVKEFKECKKRYKFSLYEFIIFEFRFFFVVNYDDIAIVFHCFVKKSQKTPTKEIDKAIRIAVGVLSKYYSLR